MDGWMDVLRIVSVRTWTRVSTCFFVSIDVCVHSKSLFGCGWKESVREGDGNLVCTHVFM